MVCRFNSYYCSKQKNHLTIQPFIFMIYQSRKRKYTSRKEKLDNSNRFLKRIVIFTTIVIVLLAILRRQMIIDYVKTFFY